MSPVATASLLLSSLSPVVAQVAPPDLDFTPMTWAAFLLANAIIIGILGPRLLRDMRNR